MSRTVVLFTDFGSQDIYVGQLHATAAKIYPQCKLIDLFHDLDAFDISGGSRLLAAMVKFLPDDGIVVGVVDPGVGGDRIPIAITLGPQWFVGPDNGLFSNCVADSPFRPKYWLLKGDQEISQTFHGRDLFLPAALKIAQNNLDELEKILDTNSLVTEKGISKAKDKHCAIIHIDRYGNLITGVRESSVKNGWKVKIEGRLLSRRDRYEQVPPGKCFWYINSIGLLEIAANKDSAARVLNVTCGNEIEVIES